MTIVFRLFKWLLIAIFTLLIALVAYINYTIYSFDTKTLPDKYGEVKTKLFLNEEVGQPLVIGLGGAEGGNSWAGKHGEKQRKLLQENGYAFLSIAYFGADGTPEQLDRIAIEGVHKAVIEASLDPRINSNCIAVMGVSRGGELALLMGSYYEEYKAVIGIVPGSSVFAALNEAMTTPGFAYNEKPLPFVPVPWSATPDLISGNLRGAFEKMMQNAEAMEAAAIRVENISGPILLISGTDDEQWPSMEMSEIMLSRLEQNNFPYPSQHIPLVGGHNEHHDNFDKVVSFLNENLLPQPDCSR
ncbi:acyl-CoA thioester hydrolase/BAAT C-terminal domain-containing protein [Simiduia curdlanivorans]|uniref:Acyl-CoA thioester hydrolase/BAAT C-terminal domain-containing protein n=1 Tax=Simiduia curdlanivorans TaxID=1492769 RepID=A0ABV8V4I0_9GAMM|nr:acyl-CoA thioester hydrolase/BAAT C-terminal domain-containing protein [Simiduia curdlanivorans]MDN3641021.1 acyl-CoA thioester hydrolase/BAAT C-terminal domain-containing protein [Simiduia curdlanivorans]